MCPRVAEGSGGVGVPGFRPCSGFVLLRLLGQQGVDLGAVWTPRGAVFTEPSPGTQTEPGRKEKPLLSCYYSGGEDRLPPWISNIHAVKIEKNRLLCISSPPSPISQASFSPPWTFKPHFGLHS